MASETMFEEARQANITALSRSTFWRPAFLYPIEDVGRRTKADRDNEQKQTRIVGNWKYTNKMEQFYLSQAID